MSASHATAEATLGGGCFWCLEPVFLELVGVREVVSGYSGGHADNPTYREVCGGRTGHAEVVRVRYDPAVIDFRGLLEVFFATHDPTTLNRQGHDVGPQYRSAIFYHDETQRETADSLIRELTDAAVFDAPIVTEVTPVDTFYPAESYHQDYFAQNGSQPYCQIVIAPKLAKFRQRFRDRLRAP